MKKITPLALAVLFALPALSHAENPAPIAGWNSTVDDGLAAGLDMMLINTSQMRNGDNVWQRAREGFQLAEVNPELVRRHEQYFASRPEYLRRTLDRSRKYLFHIMNEVEKRGMPTELAFLPVVESSFVPTARSPVGAEGLWQFMPATGREYELEQTWWYDGRRDVIESTRAALDYLQSLHGRFGDWNLALAAYNWGQGNLSRAITRVRTKGETETYENITMPAETRNYAPKLLAIRNIMAQPEKFGLRIDVLPNKPTFVAVSTGKHMNIDIAAKLAEMPLSEFKELNPAFNLPVYAHKPGRQMLVPAQKLHRFETNLAKWEKPLLTWEVHIPEATQSVTEVAQQFGMNPNELITANSLQGNRSINPGQPVLVAARSPADNPANRTVLQTPTQEITSTDVMTAAVDLASITPATAAAVATIPPVAVKTAEAVSITKTEPATRAEPVRVAAITPAVTKPAAQATTSTPQIIAANSAPATVSSAPAPRQIVLQRQSISGTPHPIVANAAPTEMPELPLRPATRVESHIVASGDTLFNISRRYGMSVDELRVINALPDNTLKLGQTLRVLGQPVIANNSAQPLNPLRTVAYQPARKTSEYTVQAGDTVFSIARKFGLHHTDIQRLNQNMVANQIQPGQVLRVEASGL